MELLGLLTNLILHLTLSLPMVLQPYISESRQITRLPVTVSPIFITSFSIKEPIRLIYSQYIPLPLIISGCLEPILPYLIFQWVLPMLIQTLKKHYGSATVL